MTNLLNGLITREDIAAITQSEHLKFDDEDRISILETMRSIDVQACPGSGKTTLIAAKLILLAKKWPLSDKGICVLSHTNVAKGEIIERLKNSKTLEAQHLLSYPHFIGTIQEFTHRFLALPLIRSNGVNEITVDIDSYVRLANKLLERHQFSWLRGTLNGLGSDEMKDVFLRETYRFISEEGVPVNISKTPKAWKKSANLEKAKRALNLLKKYLDKRGYYLYRDMYTHAQLACNYNSGLCKSISVRFSCVFIDEMQDTQKFQDELLNKIFPLDSSEVIIQRFGDPDQAIFHGIVNEDTNDSFNGKLASDMDYVVHKSHRFDKGIADKIKPLSHNAIPLETELTEEILADRTQVHSSGESFEHCVIVFNDDTRGGVVQSFGNIVSEQFQEEYKRSDQFVVKALGAVGNEIDPKIEQLKVGHYWDSYDKSKAKNNFKGSSLVEVVLYCRQTSSIDWSGGYKLLFNSILILLRLAGKNDENSRIYTSRSLKSFLESSNNWYQFRELIHLLLSDEQLINQEFWGSICEVIALVLDLQGDIPEVVQYLEYSEELSIVDNHHEEMDEGNDYLISLPENIVMHPDGFHIHLSTIHSVKGETHDATLVMETKNYNYDIGQLLNHIAGLDVTRVKQKTKIKFSRQLYVAASRPRHLLCLAIHEDRIAEHQREALVNLGWRINDLGHGDTDG